MKTVIFGIAFLLVVAAGSLRAQLPNCANDNGLNARIQSFITQGYTEINREFFQVNYLVAPTPPYLDGVLQVTLVGPYCGPACTPILRVESYDETVLNNRGNCVWSLDGNW